MSGRRAALGALLVALACAAAGGRGAADAQTLDAQQGWTAADRETFYTTDQGSRLIPADWFAALATADGAAPFAGDGLARYGYLPQPKSSANPRGLPVGFTIGKDVASFGGRDALGMTCAACHTRELAVVDGPRVARMRIDGGPGIVDFWSFLRDLDAAVKAILVTGGDFSGFARRVLGASFTPAAAQTLRADVVRWYGDYGSFMKASLPERSWGPARLDAFGMIFNRVAGLDLGLPQNYRRADAPVRYPFLWNAPRQDRIQWNGAAPNGLYMFGMGRNVGEVYGVFARMSPTKRFSWVTFTGAGNSVRFRDLHRLERLVVRLAPPRYPLRVDAALADRGAQLFAEHCDGCHGVKPGGIPGSWATPVQAAGTDARMYDQSVRAAPVATGILEGLSSPQWSGLNTLGPTAAPIDLLPNVVGETMLQDFGSLGPSGVREAVADDLKRLLVEAPSWVDRPGEFARSLVQALYRPPTRQPEAAYESRVLQGIWAAAPYLHNGSVPSLWALLQPEASRPRRFILGSNQLDATCVGLTSDAYPGVCEATSASTSPLGYVYEVGPCTGADNGNGNCGHLWGTELPEPDKWALIEHMKRL